MLRTQGKFFPILTHCGTVELSNIIVEGIEKLNVSPIWILVPFAVNNWTIIFVGSVVVYSVRLRLTCLNSLAKTSKGFDVPC